MGMFSVLYLERTEENYDDYLRNIEFNGIKDNKIIREYFFQTKPIFKGFKEFERSFYENDNA